MDYQFLGKLNTKEELKALSLDECKVFASELRTELVSRVTENGGHLASNLGVVEATLALHRVFDLPDDRLIFDVGHQCYVHKILSDRLDRFDTLRQVGGLSGFQRRDESPYDPFGGGHASTSLSAAVGFAEADRLQGKGNYTIAFVGDGAFTGGMIHEALNNCSPDLRLIIILNENEMSISKNIGAFAQFIANFRSSKRYFNFKHRYKKALSKTGFGLKLLNFSSRQKDRVKRMIYSDNYFEELGIRYLGPIDGHDEGKLETVLEEAKKLSRCCIVHIKTVKGKGYDPAEKNPGAFHGISPVNTPHVPNFSKEFGSYLTELGLKDQRICAITAAMEDGTGLSAFKSAFPHRFFDVGIAEEHALTFQAALSAAGLLPVFAVYSTFLQRSYDQLIHDAVLQHLPLTLVVDRAGLASADGPTHHGIYDVSMALSLPGSEIYAPQTFSSMKILLKKAIYEEAISFVRYKNSGDFKNAEKLLPYIDEKEFLRGSVERPLDPYVIITYGALAKEALKAKEEAYKEGVALHVLVLESLRPTEALFSAIEKVLPPDPKILFAEEGIENGGAGQAFLSRLISRNTVSVSRCGLLAIKDSSKKGVTGESLLETHGISKKEMLEFFGL